MLLQVLCIKKEKNKKFFAFILRSTRFALFCIVTPFRLAGRLLGPWHKPAVLEAFGCLIPREFHPRYDGKKPKGKVAADEVQTGVCVDAGRGRAG